MHTTGTFQSSGRCAWAAWERERCFAAAPFAEPASPFGEPYRPGQLLLRKSDERVVEVREWNPATRTYLLTDGTWVTPREVEEPLSEGRRREVERALRRAQRLRGVERGDFAAVFPETYRLRRSAVRRAVGSAALGWTLAALQAAALGVIAAQTLLN